MESHRDRLSLKGKSAIVTGASSGLGVVFARALAEAGAHVVITARRKEKLDEVAAEITAAGGRATPIECDVTDAAQVEAMTAKAWDECGRIDVLVANAGVIGDAGSMPEKLPHDLFEQTVQTNLVGLWYCCQEAGARMLADGKGGSIINITSIAGLGGMCDFPVGYQATKAGVINLTRNLACSWSDRGIRVNAIAPGYFPSEMTDPFLAIDGFKAFAKDRTPMGRVGDPDELAGALLLLASDAGSFITGHTLVVDGGYSAGVGQSRWPEDVYRTLEEIIPDQRAKRIQPR